MPEGEQLSSECETEGVFYLRKKFIVDAKSKDEQHDHRQHAGQVTAHPVVHLEALAAALILSRQNINMLPAGTDYSQAAKGAYIVAAFPLSRL